MTNKHDSRFLDLTGKKFGRWTAISLADGILEPSGRIATAWHCICDCGTERVVRSHTLISGLSMSCGCLKHDRLTAPTRIRNLTGQVYGRWHVICRGVDKNYGSRTFKTWHCICDCGNERDVSEQSLIRGKSVSCGCYRKERCLSSVTFLDLSGRTFGDWTVLRRGTDIHYENGGQVQTWICRCVCGVEKPVLRTALMSGFSQSCGCKTRSVCESLVCDCLSEMDVCYEVQKKFDGLVGIDGNELSYDVCIPSKSILIECQGEQHYEPIAFFGGDAKFEIQKKHDRRKALFAKQMGFRLLLIPYTIRTKSDIFNLLESVFNS